MDRQRRPPPRFFERCGGASRQVVCSGKVALRKAFRQAIVPVIRTLQHLSTSLASLLVEASWPLVRYLRARFLTLSVEIIT